MVDIGRMMQTQLRAPRADRGVSDDQLQSLASGLGLELPAEYVHFMKITDGYVGDVGDQGFINIWPIDDVLSTNEANEYRTWIPKWFLFASDESGDYYAFDTCSSTGKVMFVPAISNGAGESTEIALSLASALEVIGCGP